VISARYTLQIHSIAYIAIFSFGFKGGAHEKKWFSFLFVGFLFFIIFCIYLSFDGVYFVCVTLFDCLFGLFLCFCCFLKFLFGLFFVCLSVC
jgi:hypothetical protein